MKKKLFTLATLGIASLLMSQNVYNADKYIARKNRQIDGTVFNETYNGTYVPSNKKSAKPQIINPMAINIVDIGQAGNAFGTSLTLTQLWADPNLNTICFLHRSNPTITGDGTHGWYRYDYSSDGGSTWQFDLGPAYKSNNGSTPPYANARYPQVVIYNPSGNTIGDSAYLCYYGPSLTSVNGTNATNGGWGGHVRGRIQLGTTQLNANTQTEVLSTRYQIPHDFTLTKTGVTYNVDASYDDSNPNVVSYQDSTFISKGTWNSSKMDFDYTTTKIKTLTSKDNKGTSNYAGDVGIAFDDNGTTGYLTMIGHNDYTLEPDSIFYLIVYKTTNGGATWSSPINISMNGAKPLLPNSGTVTKFTTAFEFDNVVDSKGNLHIIVAISPQVSQGWAVTTKAGDWGMFDVYTTDGGTSWRAKLLGMPNTFSGDYGVSASDATNPTITIYSRGQVSRTLDGTKLFFSYFDTNDTLNYGATNMNPNAFIKAYDVVKDMWTDSITTYGTFASDIVQFGCASYYVFGSVGTYTVPIVYQEFSGDFTKTGSPVLFHYIDGLTFSDSDFKNPGNSVPLSLLLSANELSSKANHGLTVSQNYPNPFNNITTITLTLEKNTSVNIDVFNTVGQKVMSIDNKSYAAGSHTITIDGSLLSPGVYFYSVKTPEASVTQRMMVK